MKISIRNFTNKARSKKARQELAEFARSIAQELDIESHIQLLKIEYHKDWFGYYPKNKPFGGFEFMLKDGVMRITLTKFWDKNLISRKEAIVHEMTHAKQLISKKLVIVKDRNVFWNNKLNNSWKKYRSSDHSRIRGKKKQQQYIETFFPWEKEVSQNIQKYLRSN